MYMMHVWLDTILTCAKDLCVHREKQTWLPVTKRQIRCDQEVFICQFSQTRPLLDQIDHFVSFLELYYRY